MPPVTTEIDNNARPNSVTTFDTVGYFGIGYATDARGLLLTEKLRIPQLILEQPQYHYYLEILRQAGLIETIPRVDEIHLIVPGDQLEQVRRRLQEKGIHPDSKCVGLNPGAFFGSAKRWPPERYAHVADRLVDAFQVDVLIFGSREERPMAEAIARAMRHAPKVLSGETTLAELAALLECCRLFITNDSGPMHLAAAVGTKTLAIFGPTDERTTAPVGAHTRVIKRPVSCSPCLLRECPLDHRCMTGVTVDAVYQAAADLFLS